MLLSWLISVLLLLLYVVVVVNICVFSVFSLDGLDEHEYLNILTMSYVVFEAKISVIVVVRILLTSLVLADIMTRYPRQQDDSLNTVTK